MKSNNASILLSHKDLPDLPLDALDRSYMLGTITSALSDEAPVLFLEGDEGSGATTTLSQFCIKFPSHTFALFIRPSSRIAYSIDYIKVRLAEQLAAYLNLPTETSENYDWTWLLLRLRRRPGNQLVYFVVDGIHQIPAEDISIVEQVFRDILPIGLPNIRFIISGQQGSLEQCLHKKVRSKTYQQLAFSPAECIQYLSDLPLLDNELQEILRLGKGIPGRLASIKRLLKSGQSLNDLTSLELSRLPDFVRLEFQNLPSISEKGRLIAAVIAFARQNLTVLELSQMVGQPESEIDEQLNELNFLTCDSKTGTLQFISETHRHVAEKQLAPLKNSALSIQVEHLLKFPTGALAIRFLPNYLQQLNRTEALLKVLSAEHYNALIQSTNSALNLRAHADIGMKNASSLQRLPEVLKFSVQKSIFSGIALQSGLSSEVRALVSLDQPQRALSLSSQATTNESRLSLLATYAKQIKQNGQVVETSVLSYIRELSEQIDFSQIPEHAAELSEILLFVDPDLALEILEKGSKQNTGSTFRDATLAQLSITASMSASADASKITEKTRGRISNESLQKIMEAMGAVFSSFSTDDVIKAAEQIDTSRRLLFIRSLISQDISRSNILDIIEYGLDVMIRETSYRPKAIDFAELAKPLAVADAPQERIAALVKRFDSQIGLIENTSLTKDVILLQLRIARAEAKRSVHDAADRILKTYFDLASQASIEARASGFAEMLRFMELIDSDGSIERTHGVKSVLHEDLRKVIDQILDNTADHIGIVRGALRSIVLFSVDDAFTLAGRLNTKSHREEAYAEIAKSVIRRPFSTEYEQALLLAISRIEDISTRDGVVSSVLDIAQRSTAKKEWIPALRAAVNHIADDQSAARAEISLLTICDSTGADIDLERFKTKISTSAENSNSDLVKIDLYFDAAAALSKHDRTTAESFMIAEQK